MWGHPTGPGCLDSTFSREDLGLSFEESPGGRPRRLGGSYKFTTLVFTCYITNRYDLEHTSSDAVSSVKPKSAGDDVAKLRLGVLTPPDLYDTIRHIS